MPDIRIEIPTHVAELIKEHGEEPQPEVAISMVAAAAAYTAAGEKLGLHKDDFWTRASPTISNVKVIFIDVTMLGGENRPAELRKSIAETIKKEVSNYLFDIGTTEDVRTIGVLVWIRVVDPASNFAEVLPGIIHS
jgi:hypothetical protein